MPFRNSNGKMDKGSIDTLVIHHDGAVRPFRYDSLKRYIGEANYHINKGWGHISYHYIIDNIGDIYQCLDENEVAYNCGNLSINRKSIAVKIDGNMEVQKPTWLQVNAYKQLMIYLTTQRPDLPILLRGSVKGHYQIKNTACPGRNFKSLIDKF